MRGLASGCGDHDNESLMVQRAFVILRHGRDAFQPDMLRYDAPNSITDGLFKTELAARNVE